MPAYGEVLVSLLEDASGTAFMSIYCQMANVSHVPICAEVRADWARSRQVRIHCIMKTNWYVATAQELETN